MFRLQEIKPFLRLLGASSLLTVVAGCSQQQTVSSDHFCALSPGKNVDRLFAEADEKLADRSCHYHYQSIVDRLVEAAKESPGAENEQRFAELLRSSIERGVISKKQGRALFSRYFDTEFYAIKSEPRNSCSALGDKDRMYADMKQELQYKREGLLEILSDEPRFRQAQQHYADLRTVLDAVQVACSESV